MRSICFSFHRGEESRGNVGCEEGGGGIKIGVGGKGNPRDRSGQKLTEDNQSNNIVVC